MPAKKTRREVNLQELAVSTIEKLREESFAVEVRNRHGSSYGISGDPDIYGSIEGVHFELEIKREGESPTKLQAYMLKQWEQSRAIIGVASTREELDAFVSKLRNEAIVRQAEEIFFACQTKTPKT